MTPAQLRRFVANVRFELLDDELGECWIWTACRLKAGYGKVNVGGLRMLAHRASYEHFVGAIPEGQQIDHLCRHASCVNPRHLEAVTAAMNVQRGMAPIRAAEMGRSRKGQPNPFSPEHCAAIKATHRGTRGLSHSPETIDRMAAARRAWWARKREAA